MYVHVCAQQGVFFGSQGGETKGSQMCFVLIMKGIKVKKIALRYEYTYPEKIAVKIRGNS